MIKYNIGDEVECIKDAILSGNEVAPPLKLGDKYKIVNIILDSEDNQHLDVGLKSSYNYIKSWETGEELINGHNIHWCHPSRFKIAE